MTRLAACIMPVTVLFVLLSIAPSSAASANKPPSFGMSTDTFIKKINAKIKEFGLNMVMGRVESIELKDGFMDQARFGQSVQAKFFRVKGRPVHSVAVLVDNGDQTDATSCDMLNSFGAIIAVLSPELPKDARGTLVKELLAPSTSFPVKNKSRRGKVDYDFYKGLIGEKPTVMLGAQVVQ